MDAMDYFIISYLLLTLNYQAAIFSIWFNANKELYYASLVAR